MGCHFLIQGIFLTQEGDPHLLLSRQILYHWANRKEPKYSKVVFFFLIFIYLYLFIWLHQVLVAAWRIFDFRCGKQTLSCSMWGLAPRPGIKHVSPALGVQSLSHWTTPPGKSPSILSFYLASAISQHWWHLFARLKLPVLCQIRIGTALAHLWFNKP